MSEDWGLVTLPTSGDPEKIAIGRLKAASDMALKYYGTPLVVTTSGGKDSSVCVELARRAGIPFEIQHNHTTADAPETVRFVRQEFVRLENLGVKCTINYPVYKGKRTSMWDLIPQKLMPPTRIMRYCCAVLKEQGGNGRFITTGVRWAESSRRKRDRGVFEAYTRNKENKIVLKGEEQEPSKIFEGCKVAAKRVVNPIVDWTDSQVWSFYRMQRCLSIRCMNVGSAALAVSAARWRARSGTRSSDAGLLTRGSTYKPLTGCLMSAERAESWTEAG